MADLHLHDTVFPASGDRVALVDRSNPSYPRYRVRLYLTGTALPLVRAVTYHLHESFPRPDVRVERTDDNPTCALEFWTWGVFTVIAEVEDVTGTTHRLTHALKYGEELLTQPRMADVSGSTNARLKK